MNLGFALAALIALATFLTHFFAGGAEVARPLVATEALPRAAKWLSYYCWHITSILLAAMTGVFAAAALGSMSSDSVALMTALAGSFAILSAAVAVRGDIPPLRFPSTWLFALIAAAGGWGLLR